MRVNARFRDFHPFHKVSTIGRQLKWRGQDLNLRPRGYEPRELPDCSTPRHISTFTVNYLLESRSLSYFRLLSRAKVNLITKLEVHN